MWSERFWLPRNTTWKNFTELRESGVEIPELYHLLYVYPLAALLYITRLLFER